ncbi:unnamed protein product [Caenorhabditis auriculariae]|uniref:Peptidase M14 domain-containing protein n=1 Tax=Caenorhabditis auriculariae TaxID=2777116 RepID=A0A8S1GMW6_9PELO|nr:unnamed protein product [Caenorhabditis auriculariae]
MKNDDSTWSGISEQVGLVIDSATTNSAQAALIAKLERVWTEAERQELYDSFGGKKKKGVPNSGIKKLLSALEEENTDAMMLLLCRIVTTLFEVVKQEGDKKKERGLIKSDVVSTLVRVIRARLHRISAWENAERTVDPVLFQMLYDIDNRLCLKVRVGGLLNVFSRIFCNSKLEQLPRIYYRLFITFLRSPRNAQWMGRQKAMMTKLLSSITVLGRRTRLQLMKDGVVKVAIEILSTFLAAQHTICARFFSGGFFGSSDSDQIRSAQLDVIIGTIALLKTLANNRKARDEMVTLGALTICEKELKNSGEKEENDKRKIKIQDGLCSLSMRCLPSSQLPLENVKSPVGFSLPATCNLPRDSSFDDIRSSDDERVEDDEDFNNSTSMIEQIDDDEEEKEKEVEDDEEEKEPPLPKLSKLPPAKLARYAPIFTEFQLGCSRASTSSESLESMRYLYEQAHKATHFVIPIARWVPGELLAGLEPRQKIGPSRSILKAIVPVIVYNLDLLTCSEPRLQVSEDPPLGEVDPSLPLAFESRFESGNLRLVTQVAPFLYELLLSPDINERTDHFQWFYFEVSNIMKDVTYTFEIINEMKESSMYREGMQPVMLSLMEAEKEAGGWRRVGENVCYYRNGYKSSQIDEQTGEERKKRNYSSLRFDVKFRHSGDVCYFAYHFPYSYSFLNASLRILLARASVLNVFVREDVMGLSLSGNPLKILTITAPGSAEDVAARSVAVISARVHPGESNSSWMMHGLLEYLTTSTSDIANSVRNQFVFKIMPMLNPDGVVNGSHRCSLAGVDLNRTWDRPDEITNPEIFHAKGVIQYLCEKVKKPLIFVDFHGHSMRYDTFVFGSNPNLSWRKEDQAVQHQQNECIWPDIMQKTCPLFSRDNCEFTVVRSKESSARVVVWRQFGVTASYTLESTYCGFRGRDLKGTQATTNDLKKVGQCVVESFLELLQFKNRL